MLPKELFEIIRKQKVCLWIGSGFSFYAGIPSGGEIKTILYNTLDDEERGSLNVDDPLMKFTGDFETLKSRSTLIKIVQERFAVPPQSTICHDLLARISLFDSIITTNYDKMIENSYVRKLGVMVDDNDVFMASHARYRLYKVHGDLNKPDSIILTDKDYHKLYNRDFKTPFLATVLSQMSSRHIIFLGFSHNDPNILADFEKIESGLAKNEKLKFYIAPSATKLQLARLQQLGVTFIQKDGESFLNELILDIKYNLKFDHDNGYIDSETAQDFASSFNMKTEIKTSPSGLKSLFLSKAEGPSTFTITMSDRDQKLRADYKKFQDGVGKFEVKGEKVDMFSMEIEGFRIFSEETLHSLQFRILPQLSGKCGIEMVDTDVELENISYEIFPLPERRLLIKAKIYGFAVEIEMGEPDSLAQMLFKIKAPKEGATVKRSYKIYKMLILLFSGKAFKIHNKKQAIGTFMLNNWHIKEEFIQYRDSFEVLSKVEKMFHVDFGQVAINKITFEDKKVIRKLAALFKEQYYAIKDPEGLIIDPMPKSDELFDLLQSPIVDSQYLYLTSIDHNKTKLLNVEIDLGQQQIAILSPKVIDENRKKWRVTLVPADYIIIYRYQKFGFFKLTNSVRVWDPSKQKVLDNKKNDSSSGRRKTVK